MNFYVGQMVVAISDAPWTMTISGSLTTGPKKGDVLRITGKYWSGGILWLCFEDAWPNDAFNSYRFRPVVDRPTSIEIFTAMLTPAPAKHTEPA